MDNYYDIEHQCNDSIINNDVIIDNNIINEIEHIIINDDVLKYSQDTQNINNDLSHQHNITHKYNSNHYFIPFSIESDPLLIINKKQNNINNNDANRNDILCIIYAILVMCLLIPIINFLFK